MRPALEREYPDLSNGQVRQTIKQRWDELKPKQKGPFESLASAEA